MQKTGHILLGLTIGFSFIYITLFMGFRLYSFNAYSLLAIFGIIALYSLFPDIDHPKGTVNKWFFTAGLFGLALGITQTIFKISLAPTNSIFFLSAFLIVITFIASRFFEHRGVIHSIPTGIASIIPVFVLFHSLGLSLLAYVSWHSHLLGDGYILKWR